MDRSVCSDKNVAVLNKKNLHPTIRSVQFYSYCCCRNKYVLIRVYIKYPAYNLSKLMGMKLLCWTVMQFIAAASLQISLNYNYNISLQSKWNARQSLLDYCHTQKHKTDQSESRIQNPESFQRQDSPGPTIGAIVISCAFPAFCIATVWTCF